MTSFVVVAVVTAAKTSLVSRCSLSDVAGSRFAVVCNQSAVFADKLASKVQRLIMYCLLVLGLATVTSISMSIIFTATLPSTPNEFFIFPAFNHSCPMKNRIHMVSNNALYDLSDNTISLIIPRNHSKLNNNTNFYSPKFHCRNVRCTESDRNGHCIEVVTICACQVYISHDYVFRGQCTIPRFATCTVLARALAE